MITVRVTRKENVFRAITEGHAEYNPGNDVVCAAVTAIMFTLKGSVENILKGGVKKYLTENGHFEVRYIADSQENGFVASILFTSATIGMLQVQAAHPDNVLIFV